MKLVLAIVQSSAAGEVVDDLVGEGFSATRVSSTGGFLRKRNATLFIGAEDAEVDRVIEIITSRCRDCVADMNSPSGPVETGVPELTSGVRVSAGGATIFVLDMVRYGKF